jgi:hypothetical protein
VRAKSLTIASCASARDGTEPMADTIIADGDQRFEFGLDLLLAGLTALR